MLLIIASQSCKKNDTPNPVAPPAPIDSTVIVADVIDVPANVYILGVEEIDSSSTVKYWNNGKAFTIDSAGRFGTIADMVRPSAIFVSGNDVYITGTSRKNDNNSLSIGKYWKNGKATIVTDTRKNGIVKSVFVSNNDIYIAGSETSPENNTVQYWKNGVAFPLIDGPIAGAASSIFVSGNDVYVAGYELIHQLQFGSSAVYWKNGNRIVLSNDKVESAYATSVFVSGNDVYVAGDVFTGTHTQAVYWKNGVRTILSYNDSFDNHTTAIGVSGNDVYVAGNGSYVARYWKNGSSVDLTDGSREAGVTSLSIANGDVYLAGYEYSTPKYWKNGVVHAIHKGPKYSTGKAYSIFVKQ